MDISSVSWQVSAAEDPPPRRGPPASTVMKPIGKQRGGRSARTEPRQGAQKDLLLVDLHAAQEMLVALFSPSPPSDHMQARFRAPTLKPPDLKKLKKKPKTFAGRTKAEKLTVWPLPLLRLLLSWQMNFRLLPQPQTACSANCTLLTLEGVQT